MITLLTKIGVLWRNYKFPIFVNVSPESVYSNGCKPLSLKSIAFSNCGGITTFPFVSVYPKSPFLINKARLSENALTFSNYGSITKFPFASIKP